MHQIDWYCEEIKNKNFIDIPFIVYSGMMYHLSCDEVKGYFVYADGEIKRNSIAAHVKFGDTELVLKREGSFLNSSFNIYNYKTNIFIGEICGLSLTINEKFYNIKRLRRLMFDKSASFDLRFEVDQNFSNMLLCMNINRIKKRWYKTLYMEELKGSVQFQNQAPIELVLSIFFYFYKEIQSYNRS